MKSWLKPIFLFLLAVGVCGVIVMLSGIVSVGASSGHWTITRWFLNFSMERSISTYSLGKNAPALNDERLIRRGAGHYEIGCRQCHGGPEEKSFFGQLSTPKAPLLTSKISMWEPEELFTIVKHGVKFTGMPAWPSLLRDDEVWAMVAFLQKFPKMNEASYQNLVYEKEPVTSQVLRTCINCHGIDGNGRGEGAFPKLSGQSVEYLENSLRAYARGTRHSGTMQLVASGLSERMIQELARYYGSQERKSAVPVKGARKEETALAIQRGSLIAKKGIPEQHVAACIGCHGPDPLGRKRKAFFPDLRGQPHPYLIQQLKLFLSHTRGGSEHIELMEKAVRKLTPEQVRDVSLYYESLKPTKEE